MRGIPLYPLLLSLYPALSLMSHNAGQVRPTVGVRSLMVSLILGSALLGILRILIGKWNVAAMITSLALVLFFSYGPVYDLLSEIAIAGERLGRHRYLVPLWSVLLVGGAIFLLRRDWEARNPSYFMNLTTSFALLIPLISLAGSELGVRSADHYQGILASQLHPPSTMPDIYYIVLDAYGRQDVLAREFNLDNSGFLDQLTKQGFQIAQCGQSNYAQTELTFASALNLDYLEDIDSEFRTESADRSALWPMIRNSTVRRLLEDLGYAVVAYETGFRWSELEDADYYLTPPRSSVTGLTAFEATLLRSTAAWALIDQVAVLPDFLVRDFGRSIEEQYQRLDFVLDSLEDSARLPSPKFVFAHIVSPHPPFVFTEEGDFRTAALTEDVTDPEIYVAGYRAQAIYLNQRMLQVVDSILRVSEVSPVVILQGDHGPGHGSAADRMSILNAVRIQNHVQPENQTPINTFRGLVRDVFGGDLAPLPDESFFSIYQEPFSFSGVQSACEISQ